MARSEKHRQLVVRARFGDGFRFHIHGGRAGFRVELFPLGG